MASLPLAYFKGEPTNYPLVYRGEKPVRQGLGLAINYRRSSATSTAICLADRKALLIARS
jgi:hypothetical protein